MDDVPVLHRYRVNDRAEVLDFIREVFPADISTRVIAQWRWKYETNPFTPPQGPTISLLRLGSRLVGLSAGFGLQMWMGGIVCPAEGRGTWMVHPDYRGRNLWRGVKTFRKGDPPIHIGWSRLPPRVTRNVSYSSNAVRPLIRVLDAGPLLEYFTHSSRLASIGAVASAAVRLAATPLLNYRN